jgi:hypothetical protein
LHVAHHSAAIPLQLTYHYFKYLLNVNQREHRRGMESSYSLQKLISHRDPPPPFFSGDLHTPTQPGHASSCLVNPSSSKMPSFARCIASTRYASSSRCSAQLSRRLTPPTSRSMTLDRVSSRSMPLLYLSRGGCCVIVCTLVPVKLEN